MEFVAKWSNKRFYTISLFSQACQLKKWVEKWDDPQIDAYLDLLNTKYYAGGSLDAFRSTFTALGKSLGKTVPKKLQSKFERIRGSAKELKDDRLPVPAALLVQLCDATDHFFTGYTAVLFTCVWTFAM